MVWLVFIEILWKKNSFAYNAMIDTMRGDKKELKWTHGDDLDF